MAKPGIFLALFLAFWGWAGVLRVPGDFASLQDALAAAEPGDEIHLAPGRYVGEFLLSKPVRLVGSGAERTILAALAASPVIRVAEGEVELAHLTVVKGIGWAVDAGIEVLSGKLVISHSTVRVRGGTGIEVKNGEAEMISTLVTGCRTGVALHAPEARLLARESRIEGNTRGALVWTGRAQLVGCVFADNETGLEVKDGEVSVWGCRFEGNELAVSREAGTIFGGDNLFQGNAQDVHGAVPRGFRAPREGPRREVVHFPSPEYATLGEAAEAVVPGGTLVIAAGSEVEARLTLDKALTIRSSGEAPATLFATRNTPGRGPVLTLLSGAEVHLVGVNLETESYEPALVLYGEAVLRAEGCRFSSRRDGPRGGLVRLFNDSQADFVRCGFSGSAEGESICLLLEGQARALVEDSRFEGYTLFGVEARDRSQVRGRNNRFLGPGAALAGNVSPDVRAKLAEATKAQITWPNEEYESLQAAVDALAPGGTLLIRAGCHRGSAVLDKEIVITAAPGELAELTPAVSQAPVFSVLSARVEFHALAIRAESRGILVCPGSQARLYACQLGTTEKFGAWALGLTGDAQAVVEDCLFFGPNPGISLLESSSLRVVRSRFELPSEEAIRADTLGCVRIEGSYFDQAELHLVAKGGSFVEESTFTGAKVLLRFEGKKLLVRGCQFLGEDSEIEQLAVEHAVLEDCTLEGFKVTAILSEGNRLEFNRCSLRGTQGPAILLLSLARNGGEPPIAVLKGITIAACGNGIEIHGGRVRIERAHISANQGSGVVVLSGEVAVLDSVVERNRAYGIYVIQTRPVSISGSGNVVQGNGWDIFPLDQFPEGFAMEPRPLSLASLIRLPSPDYPTLRDAVRSLAPGGTLVLGDGEYLGGLYIDRELTIRAEEDAKPVIVAPPSREEWEKGEGLWSFWLPYARMPAIVVAEEKRLRLEGVEVVGGTVGVSAMRGAQVELGSVTIRRAIVGLWLGDGAGLSAEGCEVEATGCAIRAQGSAVLTLRDTRLRGPGLASKRRVLGIFLEERSAAQLHGCHIAGCYVGILLADSASLFMGGSTVENNAWGIATYTPPCFPMDWDTRAFTGTVAGTDNVFRNNVANFCPAFPGPPWPPGF